MTDTPSALEVCGSYSDGWVFVSCVSVLYLPMSNKQSQTDVLHTATEGGRWVGGGGPQLKDLSFHQFVEIFVTFSSFVSSFSACTHSPPSTTRTCRICGTGTITTWQFCADDSSFARTPSCACRRSTRCGKKRAGLRSRRRETSLTMALEPAVSTVVLHITFGQTSWCFNWGSFGSNR